MTIYDEIEESIAEMPDSMKTSPAAILESLDFAVHIATSLGGNVALKMQRVFFIRLAAMAVEGVTVMDNLIAEEIDPATDVEKDDNNE